MRRLVVALAVVASLAFPVRAHACDFLRVMGFPESCSMACYTHGSAFYVTACMWDMATDW